MSNKLEQLEFKLKKKILGFMYKHAGKVRTNRIQLNLKSYLYLASMSYPTNSNHPYPQSYKVLLPKRLSHLFLEQDIQAIPKHSRVDLFKRPVHVLANNFNYIKVA